MMSQPQITNRIISAVPGIARPVSFLAITQNIGTIDCSSIKKEVTDDIKLMTETFIDSLRVFIGEAGKAKAASDARNNNNSNTGGGAAVAAPASAAPSAAADTAATDPIDVIVIHVQEIGGKKYNAVFNEYLGQQVFRACPDAGWCSGLLMQTSNCDVTFTAMGAIIFVSKRLVPVTSVLSMRHRTYVSLTDDPIAYVGGSTYLFHGAKFSNAEKSRKGFLLTSLRIGTTCLNFCNLHLYHDADNGVAAASSPSKFSIRRQEAFLEAITEILPLVDVRDPLLLFGDFNTRLDAAGVLEHVKKTHEITVGMEKKGVSAPEEFWKMFAESTARDKLEQFDKEPAAFMALIAAEAKLELAEMPIRFNPTYLLEDGHETGEVFQFHPVCTPNSIGRNKDRPYKKERIPAWCDRIWLNPAGVDLLSGRVTESKAATASKTYTYDSVTLEKMDHEAVFLLF
jgi:inositol-1,4,5-trisphosphate 5-phosphatase